MTNKRDRDRGIGGGRWCRRSSVYLMEGRHVGLRRQGEAGVESRYGNHVSMFGVYADASVTSSLRFSSVLTHTTKRREQ